MKITDIIALLFGCFAGFMTMFAGYNTLIIAAAGFIVTFTALVVLS